MKRGSKVKARRAVRRTSTEGEQLSEASFKKLVKAAVATNLELAK